jgi:hypothetical protein
MLGVTLNIEENFEEFLKRAMLLKLSIILALVFCFAAAVFGSIERILHTYSYYSADSLLSNLTTVTGFLGALFWVVLFYSYWRSRSF